MTEIKFGTDGWRGVIAEDFYGRMCAKSPTRLPDTWCARKSPAAGCLWVTTCALPTSASRAAAAEAISATGTPVWLAMRPAPPGDLPAGAAARSRRRHHDHGQPQSLSLERRQVQGELRKLRFPPRSSRKWKWNSKKFCATEFPASPRNDLIHSLDVPTPYLDTLDGLVDWDRLAASKFASSSIRCTDRAADFFASCSAATESKPMKFAAIATRFSAV